MVVSVLVAICGVVFAMILHSSLPGRERLRTVWPYLLIIIVTLMLVMTVWVCRLRADLHFKSLYFSGDEISFSVMGQMVNLCSALMSCASVLVYGMEADWLKCILLVSEMISAAILAIRSYLSPRELKGGHSLTRGYGLDDTCVNANRNDIYSKICLYMKEEKPFLDPSFDLDDLALHFYTNRGYVSRLINVHSKMNFSQFVNKYRLDYAITLFMKDPSLKIGELASLSGYANRVTFHSAFKVFYSMTPSEWCVKYRESVGLTPPHLSTNEDMEQ